ncbi:MAG: hypothetical protein U9P14_00470 [Gemmatimonadota bacterium]|nr:hypothetical protein [Gemmatimonadota bacterium]
MNRQLQQEKHFKFIPGLVGLILAVLIAGWPSQAFPDTPADSGETVLFEEKFEDYEFSSRGWYDNPQMEITPLEHIEGSLRSCEWRWDRAGDVGVQGRGGRVLFDPVEGVTLSFHIKHSDNWAWTGVNWHPHEFHFITNVDGSHIGPAYTHITFYIEVVNGKPRLGIQDGRNIDESRIKENLVGVTENRSVAGCNGDSDGYGDGSCYKSGSVHWNGKCWDTEEVYFSDDTLDARYKGNWHHVKAHFQLNSIVDGKGINNGVLQYWYDGELIMDYHDVLFRTGRHPTMKINQFLMAPYFGTGVPHAQKIWIDDLKIIKQEEELPLTPTGGCDINGNGRINVADVIAFMLLGRGNPGDPRLDWNGDGAYGITDVIVLLMDIIKGKCPDAVASLAGVGEGAGKI